jgi:hypothetical protein
MQRKCLRLSRCLLGCLLFLLLQPAVAQPSKRVLIVGIDGAGGSHLQAANTPQIDTLIAAGTARYDFYNEGALVPDPPTGYGASGVNWSTILTGASAVHHGVVDNSFSGNQFAQYPVFFKYLKEARPTAFTASISTWAPINTQIVANPYANYEYSPTASSSAQGDQLVRLQVVSLMQTGNPTAVFVHLDQVDAAGHGSGWGSASYNTALANVDGLIGDMLTAMNQRPGVIGGIEDWLVLVTADHGGLGMSHFAGQGLINWEVPFVVSGPSVPDGAALQRGTLRDVVPTALWHLGIDPYALGLDGTVQGLPVLPPSGVEGDINLDGLLQGNGAGPVATDDVSAFLAGWLTTGQGSIAQRYVRGDLNLNGVTDLADWAILNRLSPTMGAAVARGLSEAVPEPSTMLLALGLGSIAICLRRAVA